jgi:hypothetical protein
MSAQETRTIEEVETDRVRRRSSADDGLYGFCFMSAEELIERRLAGQLDRDGENALTALMSFVLQAEHGPPPKCVACARPFQPHQLPAMIMTATPFMSDGGEGIAGVVCNACATEGPDFVIKGALDALRQGGWDDIEQITPGHA